MEGQRGIAPDAVLISGRTTLCAFAAMQLPPRSAARRGAEPEPLKLLPRTHIGLARVLRVVISENLSMVGEIHLLRLLNRRGDPIAFRAPVEAATGKPVLVAPKRGTARRIV